MSRTHGILFATAALLGAASAFADDASLRAQARIGEADATQTALAKVPGGAIKSSELEKEQGRLIWSFDITSPDVDGVTEVNVDAMSGKVVKVHHETAAAEKKEAAAEKREKHKSKQHAP